MFAFSLIQYFFKTQVQFPSKLFKNIFKVLLRRLLLTIELDEQLNVFSFWSKEFRDCRAQIREIIITAEYLHISFLNGSVLVDIVLPM